MSYVRKLGASALVVAAAFAVAFAVLVSSTSTQTAEAATVQLPAADGSVSAAPGDTVQIVVAGALAQLSITGTADGVGASFAANDGQAISCGDDASCDTDDSDDTTAGRQNVVGSVRVSLKIDDDSGEGHILVSVEGVGLTTGNTARVTKVINVSKATLVGSLKITASPKTISANGGTSTLLVEVQNAAGTPAGLNGQEVSLITTLGSIECAAGTETQACSVTTASYDHDNDGTTAVVPGGITATLNGKGVEGTATITARLGNLTETVDVTLFGTAKNLTAEPDQGSVEIGGSVYVVLTVTDGAGNPVSGQMVSPVSSKEVVGPEGDDTVPVVTEKDTAAVTTDGTESLLGRGYSKDKPAVGKAAAIPACGDDNADIDSATGTFEELFGPDTQGAANDAAANLGEGTNDKGQCVVYVTAPEDTTDATKNATRGVHTLNFQISDSVKASAEIEVAGKPSSISTDAPATVDPGSVTEITVSVFDDEAVLVGITSVKVRRVDGGGLIEDQGEGGSEMTSDGQSKFTFIAPSAIGSSEILITAGDVNHRVTLNIGEPVVEPEPEPEPPHVPALDRTPASTGYTLVTFNGGTVDELGAVLAEVCGSNAEAHATNLGRYVSYLGGAPSFVNQEFYDLFADGGIPAGEPLLVGNCGS